VLLVIIPVLPVLILPQTVFRVQMLTDNWLLHVLVKMDIGIIPHLLVKFAVTNVLLVLDRLRLVILVQIVTDLALHVSAMLHFIMME